MLIFYRPALKAGFMIVEDRDQDGKAVKVMVRAEQNGGEILVKDEAYVKQKYPKFMLTPDEYQAKKTADRLLRDDKKSVQS